MNLHTLKLNRPLEYRGSEHPAESFIELLTRMEGELEGLIALDPDIVIRTDPDSGPAFSGEFGKPVFAGTACGQEPEKGERPEAGLVLENAEYFFLQTKNEGIDELGRALSYFIRESWWRGGGGEGCLFIRCIGEDGKKIIQILRGTSKNSCSSRRP